MDPCQNNRLNSANDWAARAWFTKGCCRVSASMALQLGSPGFSSAKSITSGYNSETVRRRSADGLLRPFNGWPRTNWPEAASLPISSHNRTKLFLPVTRVCISLRALRVSTQPTTISAFSLLLSVRYSGAASQFRPQNWFSRLASTMLLCMPTSPRLKGCRTQLVSLIRSPSIRVTWRPWRPRARIAWCRYGNPDAKALPVPPQPMTARWTTRPCVRIELSLYSDMGDEFLKGVAGGFQESHWECAAGAGEFFPESCRARRVQ